jgi:large subunit ribosomal protein L17
MSVIKLGLKTGPRNRMLRNLATSLVLYERVLTTEAKAKAIAPKVERLITHARKQTIAGTRELKAVLFDMNAVRKLTEDVATRLDGRTSGFVRITKAMPRKGDGASMAYVELIFKPLEEVVAAEVAPKAKVKKTSTPATKVAEEPALEEKA